MFRSRHFVFVFLTVFSVTVTPPTSHAMELGLTPSHVFSLWTNINQSLLAYAQTLSDDDAWVENLSTMSPKTFTGKRPKDVFEKAQEFRAKLKPLIPIIESNPDWLKSFRPTGEKIINEEEITPSEVFLISTQILNGIVDDLIKKTDQERLISPFYIQHGFTEKRPSDVFGLVDLAILRSELIIRKAEDLRDTSQ